MSEIKLENKKEKNNQNKPRGFKNKIKDFFSNPKKRLWLIIISCLILIIVVGTIIYFFWYCDLKNAAKVTKNVPVKAETKKTITVQTYPAVINGIMTDQESANRHPLAIIVENHPDSRPQAGLNKADEIYETVAEGGITRFMLIYGSQEAEKVGPVRSARTYFVDWANGYNAFFAHVGGNLDALQLIKKINIQDLNQFAYSNPYWREYSSKLATEHTMYTSTTKLRKQAATNNYSTSNNFSIYKYKDDPEKANRPESQKVTVNFSSPQYKVDFQYNKETNSYKRFMASLTHNDQLTKEQLNPKNVVIMMVNKTATVTAIGEQGYNMTTQGSGEARFYIDGKETIGTWSKESSSSRELFYDSSGNEITFSRGQLWVCVVSPGTTITAN